MIGVEQFKAAFFDSPKIMRSVDTATRRALSKFAAFVRTRARTSLKYGDKPSAPVSPPTIHKTMVRTKTSKKTGVTKTQSVSPLREFIFFAYEAARQSVVIGPAKLNKIGDAPKALEYGGTSMIMDHGKTVSIRVRPRPFMHPAFETEIKKSLPQLWKNSVR
jgi:hypothetical protein